jgi:hypothetical protein
MNILKKFEEISAYIRCNGAGLSSEPVLPYS